MNHAPLSDNLSRTSGWPTAPALLAAATLAAVLVVPATARAQIVFDPHIPAPPITLSGSFNMSQEGAVGDDLAAIVGNDNGWTATLSDLLYDQDFETVFFPYFAGDFGLTDVVYDYITWYDVGSFDVTFTGPDADLLNELVASQFVHAELYFINSGGTTYWYLNFYQPEYYTMSISFGIRGSYATTPNTYQTLQTDATYDVSTWLGDRRPGNGGALYSGYDVVNTTGVNWPALSIADVSKAEGNKGSTAFVFDVTLSAASADPISVSYSTRDITASARTDYKSASGTVTFSPGETSKTITVLVSGDKKKEPNETFFVNLGNPGWGAFLADGSAVGTILNDDH